MFLLEEHGRARCHAPPQCKPAGAIFSNSSLSIVFTTPSVPLVGDRNPFQRIFFESLRLPFQRELHLVFSKTYPSFLTVKEGSTSSPKPPPPQKEGDVTAPTRSSNRYAIRLADHQRSAPGFLCGMNRMGMLAADGMLILLWTWGR